MELMRVAKEIENAIRELGVEGQRSTDLINAKAATAADYDRALGVETARLKLDGCAITVIKTQVEGICADKLSAKIIAEESLRAHYSKIDRIQAQLNALQSLFRHLEHTQREV